MLVVKMFTVTELTSSELRWITKKSKDQMPHYIDTIKKSSHVRFQYYATPVKCTGTIYTDLRDGTISDNSRFFEDVSIDTAIKRVTSSLIWLFWIVWILVTGGVVYGFYYLDNDWLNT